MANLVPPKRLKGPLSNYQIELLDMMIAELYRRVFALEAEEAAETTSGSSTSGTGGPTTQTTSIQPQLSISVDDIDGLVGEMTSFLGGHAAAAAASSTLATNVLETYISLRIL